MCDKDSFKALESRVDVIDTRLTKMETSVADSREENRRGFDEIKTQLNQIYAERAKWSEWARQHLGVAFKWIGIIILAACGITQSTEIIRLFMGVCK